jgi:hypothetical protein
MTLLSVRSDVNPSAFPHVDLGERSARPGVEGYRYVPINGGRHLGDTNTGLIVYPREEGSQVSFDYDDNTQIRDEISIVDG